MSVRVCVLEGVEVDLSHLHTTPSLPQPTHSPPPHFEPTQTHFFSRKKQIKTTTHIHKQKTKVTEQVEVCVRCVYGVM